MYKFFLVHYFLFFKLYQMLNCFKIKWFYIMFLRVVVISTWYGVDMKELHLRIKDYKRGKTAWTGQVLAIIDELTGCSSSKDHKQWSLCLQNVKDCSFRGHVGYTFLTRLRCFSDMQEQAQWWMWENKNINGKIN